MNDITPIPLNKLVISEDNVRTTVSPEGITELERAIAEELGQYVEKTDVGLQAGSLSDVPTEVLMRWREEAAAAADEEAAKAAAVEPPKKTLH